MLLHGAISIGPIKTKNSSCTNEDLTEGPIVLSPGLINAELPEIERCNQTKVITLASYTGHLQPRESVRTRSKYVQRHKEWKKLFERITIGFGSAFNWLRK